MANSSRTRTKNKLTYWMAYSKHSLVSALKLRFTQDRQKLLFQTLFIENSNAFQGLY